jgi:hypothetical protein
MEDTVMDNTFDRDRITLTEPGELIAAIPHLLGFHPMDSLVVIGLGIEDEDTNHLVLRADLPTREDYLDLVTQLVIPLSSRGAHNAVLVVVGGTDAGHDEVLPHRELLDQCAGRFAEIGVTVTHHVWAASTATGACWRCYEDAECAGFLPDVPGAFTKAQVIDGVRVYQRREDIVATLAPVAEEHLARRARLLDATDQWPTDDATAQVRLVEEAIQRASEGMLPESDSDIVRLIVALSDHEVRDASIWQPDPVRAAGAELLWTMLVRNTPAPERAEPASLLAFSAYQRGAGPLTAIALENADAADPQHRLAGLLHGLLSLAIRPVRVRYAAERATSLAREAVAHRAGGTPS